MRLNNRHQNFPGLGRQTSDRFASEVSDDEQAIVAAIRGLREKEGMSLEALGFLLGAEAAQLSRHLKGTRGTSLTNYLRIARALGYRCRIVLDRTDPLGIDVDAASDLKVFPHKVIKRRSASRE
jgi:transcriptional regulator with XRE-family HTH domain